MSSLKINEWMANPAQDEDWFELYNPESRPVALGGLYLTDDDDEPTQFRIPDLSFIGTGADAYQVFYADLNPLLGPDHANFKLSGDGDRLGLYSPATGWIDFVTFGVQTEGVSEGRFPNGAGTLAAFPQSSSPEKGNYLPLPNVVINEVLSHTDPPQQDVIEFYNPTAQDADLSGWCLSDSERDYCKFRIPDGTILPAAGFLIFYGPQFGDSSSPTAFRLNSSEGDELYLSQANASGQLTGYRASARFGAAANGISFGRHVNSAGQVDFPPQHEVTLGQANAGPLIGPLVINEIMFCPPPLAGGTDNVADEYLELHNLTSAALPLYVLDEPTNTWSIDGGVRFEFPPALLIPPNGFILLVSFDPRRDPAELDRFRDHFQVPADIAIEGPYDGKLGENGEPLVLAQPDATQGGGHVNEGYVPYVLVDYVRYLPSSPWPAGAKGTGQSLQRRQRHAYGNEPQNWEVNPPTPGRPNPWAMADNDGDHMPNSWELEHGLNPARPQDAFEDADGDRLSNLDEYRSGTHPLDAASRLRISQLSSHLGNWRLCFSAVAGKAYAIEYGHQPVGGAWKKVAEVAPPSGPGTIEMALPKTETGHGYFRLVVLPNP